MERALTMERFSHASSFSFQWLLLWSLAAVNLPFFVGLETWRTTASIFHFLYNIMLILFFANLNEFECPGNVYGRLRDKTLLFLPVIVSLKWSSRGLLAITYISCFLYSTDLWPNALLFSWLHFPFLVSPLSSKFFYVITLNLISPLVLLPYSSAVPNCQVFILENCWTGQNILGHDYKRKRGELRSTDLWIPHLLTSALFIFCHQQFWLSLFYPRQHYYQEIFTG